MADLTQAAPQEITATLEEVVRRRADLHQAILALERAAAEPTEGREEQWAGAVIEALETVEREIVDHIEITERDDGLYDEIIDVAPRLSRNIEVLRGEHPEMQEATATLRGRLVDAPVRGGRGHRRDEIRRRPRSGAARQPSPARSRPSTGRRTASTPGEASDRLTRRRVRAGGCRRTQGRRATVLSRCASSSTPAADPSSRAERRCGRRTHLRAADGNELRCVRRHPGRAGPGRRRRAPGRPRPLPLLRGARAALRRARLPRRRVRLLRPTAGVGQARRRVPYMDHVALTTPEGIQQDVRAAVEYLRSPAGGSCTESSPSASASAGAARGSRRRAVTASPARSASTAQRRADGAPGPTQRAAEFEAPILALQAGDDANIPPSTTPPSTRRSRRQASSTTWWSTTVRRTASSTASTRSTPRRRPTPGSGCSRSSRSTRRPAAEGRRPRRDSSFRAGGSRTSRAAGRRGSR